MSRIKMPLPERENLEIQVKRLFYLPYILFIVALAACNSSEPHTADYCFEASKESTF